MSNMLEVIKSRKVIAIVRGIKLEHVIDTVEALKQGGITCVEVAFNHKEADKYEDTLKSISMIKEKFGDEVAVGAGTVLSVKDVVASANAGAAYMISPNMNLDVIKKTKEMGLVSIPGCVTPTEAVTAYDAGADIIKLFPAGVLGPGYIKALAAPLNFIPFVAVGGVNAENLQNFIKAGAIGAGVGGNLVNKKIIEEGNFAEITRLASEYKL